MNLTAFSKPIKNACWLLLLIFFSCNHAPQEQEKQKQVSKDDLSALNEQILKNPQNAALLYKRSEYFFNRNNNQQAYDDIAKAIRLDSTKDDYYMMLANISFKGLQIQRAIDAFNKAIELNPQNADAHMKLSELYLYVKSYGKCLDEANLALRIDKNIAKGYFIKGFAYKETGDTGKAISNFQTAAEVKPDYYDSYIQLGNIFSVRRNPLALQYYNNALRVRPSSTEALYDRGLFLQNINEFEKASDDYYAILRLDPTYSNAHFNLGYIDMGVKEDYRSAIKHFTDAIRYNEHYVEAYYNRGLCYEALGDDASAQKDYRSALNVVPTYKLAKERLKK